ncbi:MAG: hypothetical protein D3915_07225 [Candidatus Electrothrix sp. AU1_5]|nr:hypothetical protein [Candidatus Electrothrix gigas]
MLKKELQEIILNGENSGVELKGDNMPVLRTDISCLDLVRLAGQRSPRNTIIMEVLRDYKYVDYRGMGIRTKVLPLMREMNKTEPEFILTEDYLKTVLYSREEKK